MWAACGAHAATCGTAPEAGGRPVSLALCAIALNEEQFVDGMLESVKGLVDEIVLGIDSRSSDATLDIARAYAERTLVNVRAFHFDWHDSFAEACNLAIEVLLPGAHGQRRRATHRGDDVRQTRARVRAQDIARRPRGA